jgi:ABC-type branched-subunit amino acid transport system ATPase component
LILVKGELVYGGSAADLARNPEVHIRYLGV